MVRFAHSLGGNSGISNVQKLFDSLAFYFTGMHMYFSSIGTFGVHPAARYKSDPLPPPFIRPLSEVYNFCFQGFPNEM